jgi:hypothetical protein
MGRVTGLKVTEFLLSVVKFPSLFSSGYYLFRILTLTHYYIVTGRLKAEIEEPEWTFVARQRFGKQVPAEMNTHGMIEELPCLFNGDVNATL